MSTVQGTYIGPREDLAGKTALLYQSPRGSWMAQFDDTDTGLGHKWHEFPTHHFRTNGKAES